MILRPASGCTIDDSIIFARYVIYDGIEGRKSANNRLRSYDGFANIVCIKFEADGPGLPIISIIIPGIVTVCSD